MVRSDRFPDLSDEVLFPRLSDGKLMWLAKRGRRLSFEPGDVLYEHAERDAPFYVIERGLVEFVDRKPGKDVSVYRGANDQRLCGGRADGCDRV
jgi:thioredoxin reductase (NADPH)